MQERPGSTRLRSRRRRRRLLHGAVQAAFWTLVLVAVFILGIGYGKTLSGEDELRTDQVTIDRDPAPIQATLPTKTVTVTKTVRVPAKAKPAARAASTVR